MSTHDEAAQLASPTIDLRSKPAPEVSVEATKEPMTYLDGKPILTLPNNITIRHMRPSDAEASAAYCNNRKIWINMRDRFPAPYTLEAAHEWIEINRNSKTWQASGPSMGTGAEMTWEGAMVPPNYFICLDDVAIGGIGLMFGSDVGRRTAEIGYLLSEEHWGKGFMTGVVRTFVEWVWETFPQLLRLEAGIFGWNRASCKVLEKAGFGFEGMSRCGVWKDGRPVDLIEYAKVREGVRGETVMPV